MIWKIPTSRNEHKNARKKWRHVSGAWAFTKAPYRCFQPRRLSLPTTFWGFCFGVSGTTTKSGWRSLSFGLLHKRARATSQGQLLKGALCPLMSLLISWNLNWSGGFSSSSCSLGFYHLPAPWSHSVPVSNGPEVQKRHRQVTS